MEEISKVEIEVDKVLRLFSNNKGECCMSVDKLIDSIETARQALDKLGLPNQTSLTNQQSYIINELCDTIKQTSAEIVNSHRELHVPLTKIGKSIDKNFIADYSCVSDSDLFQTPENKTLLNQAIADHLLRHGMIDVAKELIKDAKLNFDENSLNKFIEINSISNSLKNQDIRPVLDWAIKNRKQLNDLGSSLEFRIHRLNLIDLLRQGVDKQHEIIKYARKYLQNVSTKYDREIQYLMGCILYLKSGIENSPYKSILDPIKYEEIEQIFIRDACASLGLSQRSPIAVALDAGAIALPALLNINHIMMRQGVQNVWQLRDELPVEIDLGRKLHFHSIFSCPILRQQGTENNPPMRLTCGHVISRDALQKLSSSNNSAKLKCPYCPMEQSASDAMQIYF